MFWSHFSSYSPGSLFRFIGIINSFVAIGSFRSIMAQDMNWSDTKSSSSKSVSVPRLIQSM